MTKLYGRTTLLRSEMQSIINTPLDSNIINIQTNTHKKRTRTPNQPTTNDHHHQHTSLGADELKHLGLQFCGGTFRLSTLLANSIKTALRMVLYILTHIYIYLKQKNRQNYINYIYTIYILRHITQTEHLRAEFVSKVARGRRREERFVLLTAGRARTDRTTKTHK